MKSIVIIPNPVLTQRAKTVNKFDNKLLSLIGEMKEALLATRRPKGVGLAAPQVGELLRLFLTKPNTKSEIRVFVNPEILDVQYSEKKDDDEDSKLEGCLSIPQIWGHVHRANSVTLSYQDEQGVLHKETFTGFMATIIQHETDHTNGTLFTHRIAEQKGKFYKTSYDKDGKEILEEIKI